MENTKIKKQYIIFISLSFVFFIAALAIIIAAWSGSANKLKDVRESIDTNTKKLKILGQKIGDMESGGVERRAMAEGLSIMEKSFYDYSERNKFINDFSKVIKEHKKLNVLKVEYAKGENQNKLRINIPISGEYKDIKEFIYDIEKQFYFIKVNAITLNKTDSGLKGTLDITAYFGDDKSEK